MKRCEICGNLSWKDGRCKDHQELEVKIKPGKRGPDKKQRKLRGPFKFKNKRFFPTRYCTLCSNKHRALGFCDMHYRRFLKHGDPHRTDKRGRKKAV